MPPSSAEAGVAPAAAVNPAAWQNIPGVHVIVRAAGSVSTDFDMLDLLIVARYRSIVLKQMCRCLSCLAVFAYSHCKMRMAIGVL